VLGRDEEQPLISMTRGKLEPGIFTKGRDDHSFMKEDRSSGRGRGSSKSVNREKKLQRWEGDWQTKEKNLKEGSQTGGDERLHGE